MTNVNVYGGTGTTSALTHEQFNGSEFTGSNGGANRTKALAASPTTAIVVIQGRPLHDTEEYSLSGSTLTVVGALYDNDFVDVWY